MSDAVSDAMSVERCGEDGKIVQMVCLVLKTQSIMIYDVNLSIGFFPVELVFRLT